MEKSRLRVLSRSTVGAYCYESPLLIHRLMAKIQRILGINGLTVITAEVVEAARQVPTRVTFIAVKMAPFSGETHIPWSVYARLCRWKRVCREAHRSSQACYSTSWPSAGTKCKPLHLPPAHATGLQPSCHRFPQIARLSQSALR